MNIASGNKLIASNGIYTPNSAKINNNGSIVNEINQTTNITSSLSVLNGKTLNIKTSVSISSGVTVTIISGGILNITDGSSMLTIYGTLILNDGSTMNISAGNKLNLYTGTYTPNSATINNNGLINYTD